MSAVAPRRPDRPRPRPAWLADAERLDLAVYEAIAATPSQGPFYWIHIDDRTSAGIPPGEWIAWAEGRFTGALRK